MKNYQISTLRLRIEFDASKPDTLVEAMAAFKDIKDFAKEKGAQITEESSRIVRTRD